MNKQCTPVDVNGSVTRGVAYLVSSQLPDGEFQTEFRVGSHEGPHGEVIEDLVFDSSPFVTSLVLYSLQFAAEFVPDVQATLQRGYGFLASEMDTGGLWRYWSKKNPKRSIIPPDLDDTACISHLLVSAGRTVPDNRGIFYDSRDARGAFYTWLYKANSLRKWLLWLRTRGRAFSYTNELWQWTGKDDVCAVVNANVVLYLGETPQTRGAIDYLVDTLRNGREDEEIVFYAHRLSLYYMLSRALACGVEGLKPAQQAMVERIRELEQADGSFGDELLTGLAVCSLLNLGQNAQTVDAAVGYLQRTQSAAGSWKRIPMYGGPPVPTTFGSADLTTGICVEALARYAASANAG